MVQVGDWSDEVGFDILFDGNMLFQHPYDQEFVNQQILGTFTVNPPQPDPEIITNDVIYNLVMYD